MKALKNMNYCELLDVVKEASKLLEERKSKDVKSIRRRMSRVARDHGVKLSEVFDGRAAPRLNPMRDPKSGTVWRGAGRWPKGFDKARAVPMADAR